MARSSKVIFPAAWPHIGMSASIHVGILDYRATGAAVASVVGRTFPELLRAVASLGLLSIRLLLSGYSLLSSRLTLAGDLPLTLKGSNYITKGPFQSPQAVTAQRPKIEIASSCQDGCCPPAQGGEPSGVKSIHIDGHRRVAPAPKLKYESAGFDVENSLWIIVGTR